MHIKLWASTSDRMMPLCFPSRNGNLPVKETLTISQSIYALSKSPLWICSILLTRSISGFDTISSSSSSFWRFERYRCKTFQSLYSHIKQQNALPAQCNSFSCISIQQSTFTRKMNAVNAIGDVLLRPCFPLRPQPCWVCLHPQPWHKSAWQGTTSGNSKSADAGTFRERHLMGKVEVEVPSTAPSSMIGIECSQVSKKST